MMKMKASFTFTTASLLALASIPNAFPTESAPAASAAIPSAAGAPFWKDRRPIGSLFLANEGACSAINPSGYMAAKDVTTPEGRAEFRKKLLETADRCVANLKAMNAQGVIVWDIEGYEFPGLKYVGDPRMLPEFSPAMSEIAPEFFKKFTDAGLKVGVCLRPNYIFRIPEEHLIKHNRDPRQHWGYMLYKEPGVAIEKGEYEWFNKVQQDRVKDPVEELSSRIAYTKKNWGASIFYVDTNNYGKNVNGVEKGTLMPAAMWARLAAKHPDVLFIPEHENPEYYATTAPYNQPGVDPTAKTSPDIRSKYPGAFMVSTLHDNRATPKFWEDYVSGIAEGDVLFVDAGGGPTSGANPTVAAIYRDAELRKQIAAKGDIPATAANLASADPAVRLAAVRAIKGKPDPALVAPLLDIAQHDPEWLVRRAAFTPLALSEKADADSHLVTLAGDKDGLGVYAMLALGARGESAIPVFNRILDQTSDDKRQNRYDVGFGLNAVDSPLVVAPLLRLLTDKYSSNRGWGLHLLKYKLEKYPDKAAFEALLAMRQQANNEYLRPQINTLLEAVVKKGVGTAEQVGAGETIFKKWNDWLATRKVRAVPAAFSAAAPAGWPALAALELRYRSERQEKDIKKASFAELVTLAGDAKPSTRYQAIDALDATRDARAAEILASMLNSEKDLAVKRRLVEALSHFGPGVFSYTAVQSAKENLEPEVNPFFEALSAK
jgi:HEAT repeat protein